MRHESGFGLAAAFTLALCPVRGDVLISNFASTAGPPGTFFGAGSSSIFKAAGFTMPGQDHTLVSVTLSMDFGGGGVCVVSIWDDQSGPSLRLRNLSSPPQVGSGEFTFTPAAPLTLTGGAVYWVMVESVSNPPGSLIWEGTVPATPPSGTAAFVGYIYNGSVSLTPNRIEVVATPLVSGCYANCDASTSTPLLTANDFQCFVTAFVQGASYANCDGSTIAPILNGNDYVCFLNAFVAGCN